MGSGLRYYETSAKNTGSQSLFYFVILGCKAISLSFAEKIQEFLRDLIDWSQITMHFSVHLCVYSQGNSVK